MTSQRANLASNTKRRTPVAVPRLPRPIDYRIPCEHIELRCETPPPLNNLFFNVAGKGRVKSTRYRDWERVAGAQIATQGRSCILGRFGLSLTIRRPQRRCDLDGRIKALLDLLVALGVVEDDSFAEAIDLSWTDDVAVEGARIVLWKERES